MITVTHASSRTSPCHVEHRGGFEGSEPPCDPAGASCTWVTDHMSWFGTEPWFDYSTAGKFEVGPLAVSAESVAVDVQVYTVDENGAVTGVQGYYAPEGCYAFTSTSLRAVKHP